MEIITVEEVARELHVNPQSIRDQAVKDIKAFPFPVVRIGTRTIIPKKAFYEWAKIKEEDHA